MYQVRQSCFETNSSSVDVLCIPPSGNVAFPKTIKFSVLRRDVGDLDENPSVEDKLAFMYDSACEHGCGDSFINYLINKAIVIEYDTGYDYYDDDMFGFNMFEEQLDLFLFSRDAKILHNPYSKDVDDLEQQGFSTERIHR